MPWLPAFSTDKSVPFRDGALQAYCGDSSPPSAPQNNKHR